MYCPKCKDEFRAGFTRCANCDVDLVDHAPKEDPTEKAVPSSPAQGIVPMTDYCGFLSLDDARHGRDSVREEGIQSEIVIRESPESDPTRPIVEEYWLRVDTQQYKKVGQVLGYDLAESDAEDHSFDCGDCGATVGEHETFCPKCGARFDDD